MLALSRKKGESIIINDNIEIFVIDISKDNVRIGIKAPKNITIHRKEIFEQIKKQNEDSILEIDIKDIKNLLNFSKK